MASPGRVFARVVGLALVALGAACDGGGSGTEEPPPQCEVASDCADRLASSGFVAACTDTSCEAGVCVFAGSGKQGQPCDDGQACTTDDVCAARQCLGTTRSCDDSDPCTTDHCDSASGECVHAIAPGNGCVDGLDCTTNDRCDADGLCHGTPTDACECQSDLDCASELSQDLCDGPLGCGPDYACRVVPGNHVVCDGGADTTCLAAECQPATGQCVLTPRNDGVSCGSEANPCVVDGTCNVGVCEGPARDCDDGNPCTLDTCDPELAPGQVCVHSPTGGSCNDDDPCTVNDLCDGGGCVGQPKACTDQNDCTADSCDPETGQCLHENITGSCDDGVPCTVEDTCQVVMLRGSPDPVPSGVCGGKPFDCDDDNVCTSDACVNAAGKALCQHLPQPGPCDDGDACSDSDFCLGGSCAAGTPICECSSNADCDEITLADPCPGERTCDESVFPHLCVVVPGTAVVCEQPEEPCEVASCVAATGACATDTLKDGSICEDGDDCTVTSLCVDHHCVAQTLLDCDDADDCTSDQCEGGQCSSIPLDQEATLLAADFDSGLPNGWTATTTDATAAAWAVSADFTPNASGLGIVATGVGGEYGGPVEATLTSPEFIPRGATVTLSLTTRTQVAQSGCGTDKLVVSAASYGNVVPLLQVCASEAAWTLHVLDLAQFRDRPTRLLFSFQSDATVNSGFGAAFDDVLVEGVYGCDDDDACSTGDTCQAGTCVGAATVCDDQDPCTDDSCDPVTGACVFEAAAACTCTVDTDCPSAGPCVQRTCSAQGLCVDTNLSGACSDGSLCTTGDACAQGACVGQAKDCDDGNPCTVDGCAPATGCTHAPIEGPDCDDGDPCTESDACVAGVCQGAPMDCSFGGDCTVGVCQGGACQLQVLQDGQKIYEAKFDGVGPGTLPAGFTLTVGAPAFGWATATGQVVSGPNALAAVLPASWTEALVGVRSAQFAVPADGGTATVAVRAVLADPSCDTDVLRLIVAGDIVDEICDDTTGFQTVVVDLQAYAGQSVDLTFELELGPGSTGSADVRLDDLKVTGRFLCDDGQACTSDDACALGTCKGTPVPGCP
ncbi:MAG: hypothetical protein H6744_15335 [Deltaproteobacteria bacterium]|nr:hypothetical protein [Deltaproteobacteria bacterium]